MQKEMNDAFELKTSSALKAELNEAVAAAIKSYGNNKAIALEMKKYSTPDSKEENILRSVQGWANKEHIPRYPKRMEDLISCLDELDIDVEAIENIYEKWLDAIDRERSHKPLITYEYRHKGINPFRIPKIPSGSDEWVCGPDFRNVTIPWTEAPDVWTTAYDIRDRLPALVIDGVRLKDMMPADEYLDIIQLVNEREKKEELVDSIYHFINDAWSLDELIWEYHERTGYSLELCKSFCATYELAMEYPSKYGFTPDYWLDIINKWSGCEEGGYVASSDPSWHGFLVNEIISKFVRAMGGTADDIYGHHMDDEDDDDSESPVDDDEEDMTLGERLTKLFDKFF